MPRKPREKRRLTPEDIAYTIIREWEEDGYKCGEIRNKKSGATAICRIPIRTPEEERKALEPFVRLSFELFSFSKNTAIPLSLSCLIY